MINKLKIAIVTPYPPSKGTLNEYAYHLVEQFKDKSNIEEIVIITDTLPEGLSYPEVIGTAKVTIQQVWKFNALNNQFKILKTIKKAKVDAVLYNIQFLSFGDKKLSAALGLMTPMLTKFSGIPSVVLLHNILETVDLKSAGITSNPIMRSIYLLTGYMLTKMLLSADLVAVTMAKYVDILEKKYSAKNVALLPHGSFEVSALPDFNTTQEKKSIMTFGKFGTYKKVENMIEAIDIVRHKIGEPIEIVIAGTDNPNAKGYLAGVKEKYKHLLDIRFTGYVEEENVPRLFQESTFVMFDYTSTTGSSGVLHQAGSYGKAAALPAIGDLKELIEEEGYAGAFFEPGDVNGMAAIVEKLMLDVNYRNEIAEKNYIAAASLPMEDITEWYMLHFDRMSKQAIVSKQETPKEEFSFQLT